MNHPAEKTTGAGGIALLLALVFGLDAEIVAPLGVALGLVPYIVTTLVENGGIRGLVRRIWSGETGAVSIVEALLIVFLAVVILVVIGRF